MSSGVIASIVFLCALATWGAPELWTDEGDFRFGLLRKLLIYAVPTLVALLFFAILPVLLWVGFNKKVLAGFGFLIALPLLFFAVISVFGVMVGIGIYGIVFGTLPLIFTGLSLVGISLVLFDAGNRKKASISSSKEPWA